ncbi:MAG: enoyl-CoA hydratase/isomerase family protein, partial [Opitutae bacterium]|nr:enoyl-CoA hydratase/isomerase family protein [Opitutae bacterium]
MSLPVSHAVDADGIGWDPAGGANGFTPETQAALRAATAALARATGTGPAAAPVKAVVVISAKEKIFIAGADLKWLSRLADAQEAVQMARAGQELFSQLAGLGVPVVCAIHGACAGGGYELALACTWRIASDAKETVIGLPETGLGLIPGWGGSTRLPRLIGAPAAVEHMLRAALVPAARALETGLVDELVPVADLKARAKAAALRLAAEGAPARATPPAPPADFFVAQRKLAAARLRGQPAPLVLLDTVEQGAGLPLDRALALEAEKFGSIAAGEVAKNLIQVFSLKEAGRKANLDAWFPPAAAPAPKAAPAAPFQIIGIIGAGVMGSGIAQWCATRGYGVMLCDTERPALENAIKVIRGLFDDMIRRGQTTHPAAHKAMGSIGVTTNLDDFDGCDMVIEAIVENVAAKQKLFAELSKIVQSDCVLASNTSALPIEELSAGAAGPERILGLHFFNPVSRMSLVELIVGRHTAAPAAAAGLAFAKVLGKSPVICRSSPGFLVTRVLFFYLNEACRLWEEGVPTPVIDAALHEWGWPMGPMRLIDEVGVDVTDFIFGEMEHYFPGRFQRTTICARLLAAGLKGRKNGASSGFYTYESRKELLNPAVAALAAPGPATMKAEAIVDRL